MYLKKITNRIKSFLDSSLHCNIYKSEKPVNAYWIYIKEENLV